MHIIIINLNYDHHFSSPEAQVAAYFSLTGWAKGVAAAGAQVSVFLSSPQPKDLLIDKIPYYFLPNHGLKHPFFSLPFLMLYQVRKQCLTNLGAGVPTVVHWNGLLFPMQLRALRTAVPRQIPVMAQHHGSLPWTAGVRRTIQRAGLKVADGFMFAASELAHVWCEAELIRADQAIFSVMETSSALAYEPTETARSKTAVSGNPVFLWTGNLNANKDPLTILRGFEQLLPHLPEARLYMAFREATLLPDIELMIQSSPTLATAVTLLGSVPYSHIADIYNSADIWLQGSAKEGSGIALLDALACGVVPVVTDIPTFRALTDDGRIGRLWTVGEIDSFVEAVLAVCQQPLPPQKEAARRWFQTKWTFEKIGQEAAKSYKALWQLRQAA